ncbi:MFS family permease [Microbacterium endophyticum]|uniref:MFS transporter n=1 Tax=Microbacterium endophyticum TaxID=1526412 RepID=UPI0013EBA7C3|nr:MFS transporter [Microbacterium endophyticum]NIK36533.1 MFS family permease [Microbacterium endophyticum]
MSQGRTHELPLKTTTASVGLAYGVQGLGYAVVVTALPSFQERHGLDETLVAVILLGVCIAAAGGSLIADLIAVRRNSRIAVVIGFSMQALGLLVAALSPSVVLFVAAIALYGVGLGLIDAASNMQGVLVQRRWGHAVLGRFFAAYTVGAITGALVMSTGLTAGTGATLALVAAAVLQVIFIVVVARYLDPERAARRSGASNTRPLPGKAVAVAGLVVLAAFTIDSGVSTWSSSHLVGIGVALAAAPIGYAVYQSAVLVARLATDPLQRRIGMRGLIIAAGIVGAVGGFAIAFLPTVGAALVGFTLSGLCVGVLVPIAFSMAGRIDPDRSDEVVARVNLYNYAGALVGAVGVGLLLDTGGAVIAFAVPALLLLLVIPAVRSRLSAPQEVALEKS